MAQMDPLTENFFCYTPIFLLNLLRSDIRNYQQPPDAHSLYKITSMTLKLKIPTKLTSFITVYVYIGIDQYSTLVLLKQTRL